jgi:hypothetical protein
MKCKFLQPEIQEFKIKWKLAALKLQNVGNTSKFLRLPWNSNQIFVVNISIDILSNI